MALAALVAAWGMAGTAQGEGVQGLRVGSEIKPRAVGDWLIHTTRDRFSDARNVLAIRSAPAGILTVRCLDGRLSMMVKIFDGAFAGQTELFEVIFRADAAAPITTLGEALDAGTAEVAVRGGMAAQIAAAREVAFRFHTARVRFDRVFAAGAGADKAIGEVVAACPAH